MARIPKRLPRDVNARAVAIARIAIGEDEENIDSRPTETVAKAHQRAAKGGRARAASLTTTRRRQIAKKAASARWGKADVSPQQPVTATDFLTRSRGNR